VVCIFFNFLFFSLSVCFSSLDTHTVSSTTRLAVCRALRSGKYISCWRTLTSSKCRYPSVNRCARWQLKLAQTRQFKYSRRARFIIVDASAECCLSAAYEYVAASSRCPLPLTHVATVASYMGSTNGSILCRSGRGVAIFAIVTVLTSRSDEWPTFPTGEADGSPTFRPTANALKNHQRTCTP